MDDMVSMRVLKWEVPTTIVMGIELYAHWRPLSVALSIEILEIRPPKWEQSPTAPERKCLYSTLLIMAKVLRVKITEFLRH